MTQILPYGSWPSPLTAQSVSGAALRIEGARFVGDEIWWGQTVPEEGGRTTVRRMLPSGPGEEVLPGPWNARSGVHEYGGGAWTATDDGILLFVEKSDQRIWSLTPGGEPRAVTPVQTGARFGGLRWQQGRLLAIRETDEGSRVPARDIVEVPIDGSARLISLVGGSDFVAQPSLSPGGRHLAWLAWNHPDMAWDRAELRVGRIEGGVVAEWTTVAGGDTSPLQPEWASEDDLLFADDPSGRWNLQRLHLSASLEHHPVAAADSDTGGALWSLGSRWYEHLADGRIVAVRTDGDDELVVIDTDGTVRLLPIPASSGVSAHDAQGTRVLVSGAGHNAASGLWVIDVDRPDPILVQGGRTPWGDEWMPRARAVSIDGRHGSIHTFVFPPTNPDARAPEGERPPYLVVVHGGPTDHVGSAATGKFAYFTSRGIGVLAVNYGGSTGYGRDYRERLRGQWGVVDVDDVAAAALGVAAEGFADPARLVIEGGSAGGWTVLAALANTDVFAAGVSRYGVGDARALAADTHDFEAHYLDGLIGPLPEAEEIYRERSPLSHADRFSAPILLLQGADDKVVPPAQSEAIRDALADRGIPHAYVLYEGEGHGFRRAETVIHSLETELAFLGAVFGFDTPGVEPVTLT